MERRIRKKKRMDGKGLTDAALGFDAELRRGKMLCVIDRLTEEEGRFLADFSKFKYIRYCK